MVVFRAAIQLDERMTVEILALETAAEAILARFRARLISSAVPQVLNPSVLGPWLEDLMASRMNL